MKRRRPTGITSRLKPGRGPYQPWVSPDGQVIDLPVVLDIMNIDPDTTEVVWLVEATVDLANGEPILATVFVHSPQGLDTEGLQQDFRWGTPLEVVTTTVPQLLAAGIDPYRHDYATDGYPDAADLTSPPRNKLTDAFLEEIVRRYLRLGRGYAKVIAGQYQVSPRTVVSWIEKARERGILSATAPGTIGGHLLTREDP